MRTWKNTDINWIKFAGEIIIPTVIYYFTRLIAYIVLTSLVIGNAGHMGSNVQGFISENEATVSGIISGLSMLLGMTPLLPDLKRELAERCKSGTKALPQYISIPVTITLAITGSVALNFLFALFHFTEISDTYSEVAEHQYGVEFIAGLILYGMIAPAAEESVFRGIIYNKMRKNCSVCMAALVSALIFGVYHGNIVQGAYGFLIGIIIACVYEGAGSLFHAFLFHAAANIAVYTITSNEKIYSTIMTPYICAAFLLISAFLLYLFIRRIAEMNRN